MKYLIYVAPPSELSSEIRSYGKKHGLQETSHPPHCTLLTTQMSEEDETLMLARLEMICHAPLRVTLGALDFFDENAVVVSIQKTREIADLHQLILEGSAPFVDRASLKEYAGTDPSRSLAFSRYGSAYAGECYAPHITLGHSAVPQELPNPFEGFSFVAPMFKVSKKDGVWKKVKEYSLWLPE